MATISKLQGMKIDEVSLVRRPANQHAAIVFSKADEGDDMPPGTIYTESGEEVSIDDLELGTLVEGEDGEIYEVVEDDSVAEVEESDSEDREPALVGKSDEDYAEMISKAYSEAVTEEERARLIAGVAREAQIAKAAAKRTDATIAKMKADAYVDECIAKAEEYGIAGPRTEQFGVAISKMLTVLSEDEAQLMDDIFKSFAELAVEVAKGSEAVGASEVMEVVESHADEIVKSANGGLTKEQAMAAAFEANPDLYAMYLAEQKGSI